MADINAFDEANAHEVMMRAKALLAELTPEFGVTISRIGMQYGRFELTIACTLMLPVGDYDPTGQGAEAFKTHAVLHGIPAELLGKKFFAGEKEYMLTGYRLGTNKKPLTKPFTLLIGHTEYAVSESHVKRVLAEAGLLPAK